MRPVSRPPRPLQTLTCPFSCPVFAFYSCSQQVGVVPGVIFYFPDDTGVDPDRPLLRFAICKRRDTIEEAVRRIREMEFPSPK